MKKFILLLALIILSCSDENSSNPVNPVLEGKEKWLVPLEVGNKWVYNMNVYENNQIVDMRVVTNEVIDFKYIEGEFYCLNKYGNRILYNKMPFYITRTELYSPFKEDIIDTSAWQVEDIYLEIWHYIDGGLFGGIYKRYFKIPKDRDILGITRDVKTSEFYYNYIGNINIGGRQFDKVWYLEEIALFNSKDRYKEKRWYKEGFGLLAWQLLDIATDELYLDAYIDYESCYVKINN